MDEIWKDILDTDYCVSNMGRVASRKYGKWRIMRLSITKDGYARIYIRVNGIQKNPLVHRLVSEAFLGPPPTPAHEVNHIDGCGKNNCVENLEWGTKSQNSRHRFDVLKRGNPRGAANGMSKRTEAEVREIRRRRAAGELLRVIAADYGIGQSNVSYIARRKTWSWLK